MKLFFRSKDKESQSLFPLKYYNRRQNKTKQSHNFSIYTNKRIINKIKKFNKMCLKFITMELKYETKSIGDQ